MRIRRGILLTGLVVAGTAAPAQAQWVVTPYIGTNVGDVEKGKGGIGGTVDYFVFAGRLAFEFDVKRHWHFFKDADLGNTGKDQAEDIDTRATTFMGNVVVPFHLKGATNWRAYGTAGLGVIRATFVHAGPNQPEVHQSNLGFDVDGGVMHALSSRVGIRVDLRYFRALAESDQSSDAVRRSLKEWLEGDEPGDSESIPRRRRLSRDEGVVARYEADIDHWALPLIITPIVGTYRVPRRRYDCRCLQGPEVTNAAKRNR
jgi:hypothetical protein